MSIILGIDPGSRLMGYGVIHVEGQKNRYIDSGCIKIRPESIPSRVQQIFRSVSELLEMHKPDEAAVEEVFMHANAKAALILGQARGAAIAALTQADILVKEYSARQVKKAIVGTGAADKTQVQHMVKTLLQLPRSPQADAADALAIALCHVNTQNSLLLVNHQRFSRRRLK